MSVWTHVTGAIRLDGLPNVHDKFTIEKIREVLGNTCTFDSLYGEAKACNVPCGSEGSIQYHIHEYGTGLPWVVVTIWGDLRDYENVKEIEEWFLGVCRKWGLVRQGIIEIEVEGKESVVVRYIPENEL